MLTHFHGNNQSLIEDGIEPNDYTKIPKSYSDGEEENLSHSDSSSIK